MSRSYFGGMKIHSPQTWNHRSTVIRQLQPHLTGKYGDTWYANIEENRCRSKRVETQLAGPGGEDLRLLRPLSEVLGKGCVEQNTAEARTSSPWVNQSQWLRKCSYFSVPCTVMTVALAVDFDIFSSTVTRLQNTSAHVWTLPMFSISTTTLVCFCRKRQDASIYGNVERNSREQ